MWVSQVRHGHHIKQRGHACWLVVRSLFSLFRGHAVGPFTDHSRAAPFLSFESPKLVKFKTKRKKKFDPSDRAKITRSSHSIKHDI